MSAHTPSAALHTSAQVRAIDARAVRSGIDAFELMRRAAAAAFECLRRRWPEARRIGLLAGSGNNGGDAFLLGERALREGLAVEAVALAARADGDAARARAMFIAAGGRVVPADAGGALIDADVHVDGLFGTGLDRPVHGAAAALIGQLHACGRPVLALDVPSGLDADTGARLGMTVRAAATICFVAWKRGLFTNDAVDCCGALELAGLDLPHPVREGVPADAHLLDASLARLLRPRPGNANKSSFGHVLVVGGDTGMGGSVRLAGEAALRCGAGLASVATRHEHVAALNSARPELMGHGVETTTDLVALLERASVVAAGPGLGRGQWGRALLDAVLASGRPQVLDADALNLLAEAPQALPAGTVLTPHPGEAARLLGCSVADVQRDRFAAVRSIAARHAAVVVLKGAGSLVCDPRGELGVCRWGNSGMASGGMGDLLTGVIAALRAQGLDAWGAARLGVAMHARAGDLAAGTTPRGLLAGDLLAPLRLLANGFSA